MKDPDRPTIERLARLIKEHYPHIEIKSIVGHREVNPTTTCPGNNFLGGWKNDLLELLQ